jgi:hypothetical protein
MPRTSYHLYFEVNEVHKRVQVLAAWHMARGRDPDPENDVPETSAPAIVLGDTVWQAYENGPYHLRFLWLRTG